MSAKRATLAVATALALGTAALPAGLLPTAGAAIVGSGFTVTPADLAFILKQIKISEQHAATYTAVNPCGTLVGPGADQIPDRLTSYGLRTVDGSCNNLFPGRDGFAAADRTFPRLTTPVFKDADPITAAFPVGPPGPTSYKQKSGSVVDAQPRIASNLIVDQTSTNPAALAAAAFPVRTQAGTATAVPCTTDPDPSARPPVDAVPVGCTPSHQTLFIPNVTTDVGLSPPYNSLFTFFGQFFDHGVDQTVKGGGTVFVPLKNDDPLVAGKDHIFGNADDLPVSQRFMVLTRAQNQPGPDGLLGTDDDIQDANNTDTPWVDQSQTYTSHGSHQAFLREYAKNSLGKPVSTGRLLGGLDAGLTYAGSPDGRTGIGTWKAVKQQAATLLGLRLVDADVTNIPMLAVDPYGKFKPGPNGLPQYVTTTGLIEGNIAIPVPVPADVLHFDTPFFTDIAHNADPSPQDTDHNPATPPVAPTPDADNTPSADFANQPAGTYDDEMLDAHFACGDGRCNENIALSTIHQVFHSEHDRLISDMRNTLTNDNSPTGVAALSDWRLATTGTPDGWNGERLFQAARFVTEMEYQHTVFEEFARKVQPAVRPFHVYSPDVNPAIKAEFAHAVYRFGHSMLDDTVARTNVDAGGAKSDNSLPLLKAFLNPPEFFNGGLAGPLTPEKAAGSVAMGSSSQVGNELDEFVTETLRNNLLGLPLDLPALNMARAREAGVPSLNGTRRQIHATTNDAQMSPYTDWTDFGQHLKHPESLINFVAAYGQHPTVVNATSLADKRAAAKLIVDPAPGTDPALIPADAAAFMFSTSAYANTAAGVTTTGLDDVDLWVGGLAEKTNLFGGLLGSTFNYVFQNQLENLQDGDRLYYLNRTVGMNLRTQLEGNSFGELIQRNTEGTNSLKADAFATADCRFQLANLAGTPAGFLANGSTVTDDVTTTDCDESKLLLRKPDGTIQYRAINSVNPSGINSQAVYNGTANADRVYGGNDNDTFWGGPGNDVIEGNGGDDVALGGDGNDIITDLDGADVLKGGPGNDAIDAGPGNDIVLGGDGQDFTNGGANDNETFAGPGNDFVIAGLGADAVFGDGGDDWIEGGSGQDLLQGDHGAPFFNDPAQAAPGNDIMIGQVGENDYDAEGGDDIMSANAAIDRFAGAGGFDWAIHQYDTVAADDDMKINQVLAGLPLPVIVNRDRWQETEANSGSAFNDSIKGDDAVPSLLGGAGFTGCDALDQAGLDRISGLAALLPPVAGFPETAAAVAGRSFPGACPLTGNVWGQGNILLGGAGSDTIEGRSANDIIDGDKALTVRISVRNNPADAATQIGSADLMESQYLRDSTGALTGPTLQAAVFAGTVDPGNLVAVREITSPAAGTDVGSIDTAVFSAARAAYTISSVNGVTTVNSNGGIDGIDTLTGIEALKFSDGVVTLALPAVMAAPTALAGDRSATVSWVAQTPPAGGSPVTRYEVVSTPAGSVAPVIPASVTATSVVVPGLLNGTAYTFTVRAVNQWGAGPDSPASGTVTPFGDTTPPIVTSTVPSASANGVDPAAAITATLSEPVVGITLGRFTLKDSAGVLVTRGVGYDAATNTARINPAVNLAPNSVYTVRLTNPGITDVAGNPLAAFTWRFTTGAATVNTPPGVTARTPALNGTGFARTANITATFSEAVTGVTSTTMRLQKVSNGASLNVAVTYDPVSLTATLDPALRLAGLTQYRVVFTPAGIRDAGNAPLVPSNWTFTTGP